MISFECDPKKAASNLVNHKVSFEEAAVTLLPSNGSTSGRITASKGRTCSD
jgi:uncharacterized DUF497 family protein